MFLLFVRTCFLSVTWCILVLLLLLLLQFTVAIAAVAGVCCCCCWYCCCHCCRVRPRLTIWFLCINSNPCFNALIPATHRHPSHVLFCLCFACVLLVFCLCFACVDQRQDRNDLGKLGLGRRSPRARTGGEGLRLRDVQALLRGAEGRHSRGQRRNVFHKWYVHIYRDIIEVTPQMIPDCTALCSTIPQAWDRFYSLKTNSPRTAVFEPFIPNIWRNTVLGGLCLLGKISWCFSREFKRMFPFFRKLYS